MYFKQVKNRLQLIVAEYNQAKKRTIPKMIASIPMDKDPTDEQLKNVPADVRDKITAEQLKLLTDHLAEIKSVKDRQRDLLEVDLLAWSIGHRADAVGRVGVRDERQAKEIWEAVEKLQKALKAAGYPHSAVKPAKATKALVVPPGQLSLDGSQG
jgi:hypothetical protein